MNSYTNMAVDVPCVARPFCIIGINYKQANKLFTQNDKTHQVTNKKQITKQ